MVDCMPLDRREFFGFIRLGYTFGAAFGLFASGLGLRGIPHDIGAVVILFWSI